MATLLIAQGRPYFLHRILVSFDNGRGNGLDCGVLGSQNNKRLSCSFTHLGIVA